MQRTLHSSVEIAAYLGDGGHEQLISNGGRFKSAFAKRDKKQRMIGLQEISTNWCKNRLCPSTRLSLIWVWKGAAWFSWAGGVWLSGTYISCVADSDPDPLVRDPDPSIVMQK
jgi:hypothetical protein